MSKEIDLIKCIISEIDDNLYSDFGGNPCIRITSNLKNLLLALDTPEVRHFFENCNNQAQHIADLEAKLAESEKKREELDFSLDMETTSNQEETEKLFKTIGELKQQLAKKEKKLKRVKEQEFYQFRLAAKWAYENSELKVEIDDLKQKLTDALKDFDDIQKENDKLACQLKQENFTSIDTYQHYEHQIAELGKEIYRLQQREKFLEQQSEKLELMLDKVLTELHTNCYSGLNIIHFKKMMLNDLGGIKVTNKQLQTQIAITELKKAKQKLNDIDEENFGVLYFCNVEEVIDQQIKQLEGNEQC